MSAAAAAAAPAPATPPRLLASTAPPLTPSSPTAAAAAALVETEFFARCDWTHDGKVVVRSLVFDGEEERCRVCQQDIPAHMRSSCVYKCKEAAQCFSSKVQRKLVKMLGDEDSIEQQDVRCVESLV